MHSHSVFILYSSCIHPRFILYSSCIHPRLILDSSSIHPRFILHASLHSSSVQGKTAAAWSITDSVLCSSSVVLLFLYSSSIRPLFILYASSVQALLILYAGRNGCPAWLSMVHPLSSSLCASSLHLGILYSSSIHDLFILYSSSVHPLFILFSWTVISPCTTISPAQSPVTLLYDHHTRLHNHHFSP